MDRSNDAPYGRTTTSGSDFLHLATGDAPPRPGLSDWLTGQIRRAVADGRLAAGDRLPPSRVLAAELRVSRGVVTEAYRRLAEEGHVTTHGRAGTVVAAAPGVAAPPPVRTARRDVFAAAPGVDVFDAVRAAASGVDLTPGVPDLGAFPRAAWLRAERAVLATAPSAALGYGDPRGAPELRSAVAGWLARYRGIRVDPADVLVVAGTAQALTLLGRVLSADGIGAVAVEDPGSLGARQHLRAAGLATPPVPVDADGLRIDALTAPAVLATPAHQFPTGAVLGGRRRRELLAWAADGGLVIEDDYDAEHRYDRPPVPALRARLPDRVAYAGSVSKLLAPALRIGWLLAPPRYRRELVDAKRVTDLGNAALPQLVLARLMASGALERHLRQVRRRHRARRDAMLAAIRTHLPGATVLGAPAGLHLTVTFDGSFADTALAAAALAAGVTVQPLSWHCQRPQPPGLVLGYAANPPDVLAAAVATVAAALSATAR